MEAFRRLFTRQNYNNPLPNRAELHQARKIIKKGYLGWTILHYASSCKGNSVMLVFTLWRISTGREIIDSEARDYQGKTALQVCIECNPTITLMLLDAGTRVDSRNRAGETPLHNAVMFGRLDSMDILLDHGADIEAESNNKRRCLYYATIFRGRGIEVIKHLLEKGANPNESDGDGDLPIHHAETKERLDAFLAAQHGDINVRNGNGKTCLHLACRKRNYQLVVHLLELGANPNLRDHSNNTAISLATGREFKLLSDLTKPKTVPQNQPATVTAPRERDTNKPFSEDDCNFSGNSICPIREWWSWKECQAWMTRYTTALNYFKQQGRSYIHISELCASTRNLKAVYERRFLAKEKLERFCLLDLCLVKISLSCGLVGGNVMI
jgi:ankyrin repeat protein